MFFHFFIFLLACHASHALTYPATVEVDLVFPRNESYAPRELFPVVFSIQNAQHAYPLYPEFDLNITSLKKGQVVEYPTRSPVDLANHTESDPYFFYYYVYLSTLTDTEDDKVGDRMWLLSWKLSYMNCTAGPNGSPNVQQNTTITRNITFTISDNSQQVDLVAATSDEHCHNTDTSNSFTFNVTSLLDADYRTLFEHRNSCSEMDVQHLPASPCAIKIDNATAASMEAAIASSCEARSGSSSCHADESAGKRAMQLNMGGMTGLAVSLAWASFLFLFAMLGFLQG